MLTCDSNFDDPLPTEYYRQFAQRAGCLDPHIHPRDATAADDVDSGVFECLQNADTLVLQNASAYTSLGARFGQWAFIPVTDGNLIQEPPSKALKPGEKLNGERLLVGVSILPALCTATIHTYHDGRPTQTKELCLFLETSQPRPPSWIGLVSTTQI